MKHAHLGWTLVLIGGVWEAMTLIAKYDATVTGAAVSDTLTGKLDGYFEQINPLPIDIGTILLLVGGFILVYPSLKGR